MSFSKRGVLITIYTVWSFIFGGGISGKHVTLSAKVQEENGYQKLVFHDWFGIIPISASWAFMSYFGNSHERNIYGIQ